MCLGFKPGAACVKVQTNPLSFSAIPLKLISLGIVSGVFQISWEHDPAIFHVQDDEAPPERGLDLVVVERLLQQRREQVLRYKSELIV